MPLVTGGGGVKVIEPFEAYREGLFYIPGDLQLSEYENELFDFWIQSLRRRDSGLRGTCGISVLSSELSKRLRIDYVIYDLGPNIGPLNRAIVLDAHYLVVPVACDSLSVRAIRTMGRSVASWVREWDVIRSLAPSDIPIFEGRPRFLGYIPQRFRVYRGQIVAAQAMALSQIRKVFIGDFSKALGKAGADLTPFRSSLKLGEVQDFGSLAATALQRGRPFEDVSDATAKQRRSAEKAFREIARNLISRTNNQA